MMPNIPVSISFILLGLGRGVFAQTAGVDSLSNLSRIDYSPSLIGIIFKLLFSMALIVGLIYLSTFLVKKVNARAAGGATVGDTIKVIGRTFLSPKQTLYIVKIGKRYSVLGATENSINMISELSESEAERLENMENGPSRLSGSKFSDILKGIIKK